MASCSYLSSRSELQTAIKHHCVVSKDFPLEPISDFACSVPGISRKYLPAFLKSIGLFRLAACFTCFPYTPLIGVVNFVHSCTIAYKNEAMTLELCGHEQFLRSYLSHYELRKLGQATKYLLALTHFILDKWAIMGRSGDLRRARRREPDSSEVRDHQALKLLKMKFYLNVKIPVIVSGDAVFGYSVRIGELQHAIEEPRTTEEARGREEFQGRDEAQGREEYHTREQSRSRGEYEAREQVRAATEEARSNEEYPARGSEDQAEMPQHKQRQHKRRGHKRRGYYPFPEFWTDSDPEVLTDSDLEPSRDNRFDQSHNLSGAVGLGISCDCQLRGCRLPARSAIDPNRAGPPQVSQINTNATRRPPVPGATGRFDIHVENLHRLFDAPFLHRATSQIKEAGLHQPPSGNPHVAASTADASQNHPRKRLETPREVAFRLCNESVLRGIYPGVNVKPMKLSSPSAPDDLKS